VGGVFNIASGRPTTVNRLLEEIEALTGVHVPVTHAEPRVGEVRHSLADIGRARRDLGYVPATDLREGLRWTVAYFLEGRTAERGATPRPRDTR
jgi:nucleoside-diphosphate-sugar epimerase